MASDDMRDYTLDNYFQVEIRGFEPRILACKASVLPLLLYPQKYLTWAVQSHCWVRLSGLIRAITRLVNHSARVDTVGGVGGSRTLAVVFYRHAD